MEKNKFCDWEELAKEVFKGMSEKEKAYFLAGYMEGYSIAKRKYQYGNNKRN
jgi:hypothetical protein